MSLGLEVDVFPRQYQLKKLFDFLSDPWVCGIAKYGWNGRCPM